MRDLRGLTASGALLVALGCALGWYEVTFATLVDGPVRVVRPDGVLSLDAFGWLVLAPLVLAPLVPSTRRAVGVALGAVTPGVLLVVAAAALPARSAVVGETLGEVVAARTLGQALSLVGALIVVMALVAAWRRAPDWRVPPRWWHARGAGDRSSSQTVTGS
jgi:hypothetical protein